jgi:protein phosphatase 1 regulatory subunit 7
MEELTTPAHPLSDDEDDEDLKPEGADEARDDDFLATYPDDTEELHLQHLRLHTSSLPPLRFPRFTQLGRLCLRQNEISSPLPAECFMLDAVEEVDFYDNRLGPRVEDVEVAGMKNLTCVHWRRRAEGERDGDGKCARWLLAHR